MPVVTIRFNVLMLKRIAFTVVVVSLVVTALFVASQSGQPFGQDDLQNNDGEGDGVYHDSSDPEALKGGEGDSLAPEEQERRRNGEEDEGEKEKEKESRICFTIRSIDPVLDAEAGTMTEKQVYSQTRVKPGEIVFLVIDALRGHCCPAAAKRMQLVSQKINRFLSAVRPLGIKIVHSPSSFLDFLDEWPQRKAIKGSAMRGQSLDHLPIT